MADTNIIDNNAEATDKTAEVMPVAVTHEAGYTPDLDVQQLWDNAKEFRKITDPDAISPAVLANLLDEYTRVLKTAAKAFGIPRNIPYADSFGCESEANSLKMHHHYRRPDGSDAFHAVSLPAATTKHAGVMSADDKRALDSAANWLDEAKGGHMELIYQINAKPTAGSVPIEVATLDIMNPGNGEYDREIRTTIEAATTETAGVMTAADKDILNTLAKEFKTLRFQMDHVLEVFEKNGW